MESASFFNFNSSTPRELAECTPVKPRLGKFLDFYSPEHLNLTPKHHIKPVMPNENIKSLLTPENYFNFNEKCRTVKTQQKLRNVCSNYSFEGNQSFPRLSRRLRPIKMDLETPTKVKQAVDLVRVDGPNGLRFNTSLATGEVVGSTAQSQTDRLQQSINTTKALFIIEPNSSKILIVNNKACSLLGYSSGELCDFRFTDLLRERSSEIFKLHDAGDVDISEDGPIILPSGKVVELVSKDGGSVQVSLWMRQNEGSCLVVAEPVICKNVVLTIDADTGTILSCDGDDAAMLFQAESSEQLIGLPVASLIPSIQIPAYDAPIPKNVSKQDVTGRTLDGRPFPLCLWISTIDSASSVKTSIEKAMFIVNVRVTYNVSGLIVVDESGIITACNQHFAMLTFGKPNSEVIGHHIENVIQNFCRESDLVKLKDRNRNMTQSVNNEDDDSADTEYESCEAFNGSQKSDCMYLNVQQSILSTTREKSSRALCLDKPFSMVTHTPTPTQDMVSSVSATEQRNDTSSLPDVTSGISGISIDDENYCQSGISESHSENILRSEQSNQVEQTPSKKIEKSDSIYYTFQHSQEFTPTGNSWLSLDSSEYKSIKANLVQGNEDSSIISLSLCDSNETNAEFFTPINEMPPPVCEIENLPKHNGNDESIDSLSDDNDLETQTESPPRNKYEDDPSGIPCADKRVLRTLMVTSTPQQARNSESPQAVDCGREDGTYRGLVLHKDGTELGAVYTVSSTQLGSGRRVRCVWLRVRHASRASADDNSLVLGNESASSGAQSMSLVSQLEQIAGEYNKNYANLKQIGNGTYSCVKMAYRRADRLPCVAKFILKEKVGAASWSDAPDGRRVPLELSLLLTLDHPNIVSVIDWYENEKYFQMVMEKHGAGMDLFEFIERRPRLDEPLLSYIFRQIGQAVEYLHSLNILHRDIKDENVIIDNKFHVKLIDFSSATFMSKDTLFSTFYGTIEDCSPEVLAGNKYAGPELEMWSMGMLLYGLTFFVKPFSDIEDTIQGALTFPEVVSEELEQLLRWMLCKEPLARCSVPELMAHPWLRQPVAPDLYVFQHVVDTRTNRYEASPEIILSGGPVSPRSASPGSLAELLDKEVSMQCVPVARALSADTYSLHSSTDILDKYITEADIARDIDDDCNQYECEQHSFS